MNKSQFNFGQILKEMTISEKEKFEKMTAREKEVLGLTLDGHNSAAISKRLNISKNTVSTHRKNINKKTNLKSPKEKVLFALAFNII